MLRPTTGQGNHPFLCKHYVEQFVLDAAHTDRLAPCHQVPSKLHGFGGNPASVTRAGCGDAS
jgi:hypothetical protein